MPDLADGVTVTVVPPARPVFTVQPPERLPVTAVPPAQTPVVVLPAPGPPGVKGDPGNNGLDGADGVDGLDGTTADHKERTFATAAASWEWPHSLGYTPGVTLMLPDRTVIGAAITYNGPDRTRAEFSVPVAGIMSLS